MIKITDVSITLVEIPQIPPIAPYRSHIRTSSTTRHAIVCVDTDQGLTGWGEFNVNFLPDVSARRMQQQATDWLLAKPTGGGPWDALAASSGLGGNQELYALNIEAFHRDCPLEVKLKSGIEMALWDILGKSAGLPVARLLGGIIRQEVEVAACMGIQSYERAGEIAAMYVEKGFGTLKTKAGSDMDEDLQMVRGIRDAVGDKLKLRIDPNRAYTPQQAAELARRLEEYDLEYFEQPIPAEPLSDANRLRGQTSIPIALNESVTDPASAWEILHAEAADVLLPDTHIAGGLGPCVKIGHVCESAGVPCVMHCGHDLGPKTAAMVHIAATCPAYSLANDTTYYGLEDDVLTESLPIVRGHIAVPDVPGLGIEVDPQKLKRYAVE